MKNPAQMTNAEIKNEMESLRYKMEYSVHRRHDAPEMYAYQFNRYDALDNEEARR